MACGLTKRNKGKIYAVYVIEVARALALDAEMIPEAHKAEEVLSRAEQIGEELDGKVEGEILQARDAGHAIVDEAIERRVSAVVLGVGYERPLGEFEMGHTAQYVIDPRPLPGRLAAGRHTGVVMKVVIMGCGRVGATLATMLADDGHEVTVIDIRNEAFRRLPADFKGKRHVGNAIDQDVLARIGLAEADAFIAVTQGDNRNVMATQMAKHIFGVARTLCRIYDPIREEMYRNLGIETISPTIVGATILKDMLDHKHAAAAVGSKD